jgi:hypothetical protein
MAGGLLQLVAYGAQDIYLTGNPQMTFFKVVYRRHTNFAMEAIEQTFSGQFNPNNRITVTVARNGDLLGRIYLEFDVTHIPSNDNEDYNVLQLGVNGDYTGLWGLGTKFLEYVEVEIGGQVIDKHYGIWMNIWAQLTKTVGELLNYDRLTNGSLQKKDGQPGKIYVPLDFWFCTNPGLYLPLVALQYHEVKLNIEFVSSPISGTRFQFQTNYRSSDETPQETEMFELDDISVYCDYVFLDTDERRRFAQVSHEYLIEQVQFSNKLNAEASNISQGSINQFQMNFNHPVKELIWISQKMCNEGTYYFFTNESTTSNVPFDPVVKGLVKLNNQDRFKERDGTYFRCVQPYQHHTGAFLQGYTQDLGDGNLDLEEVGYMYVYSFALKPESHQPSGTCNFSRIDNSVLLLNIFDPTDKNTTVRIYATNYNVLRIMSGMGGLAYSN